MVPTLEPVQHCLDIPKEVCVKSRVNPVKKRKPAIRRWCPSQTNGSSSSGAGGEEEGGEISVDWVPTATSTYVLSWLESDPTSDIEHLMRAQIVDVATGEQVCSSDFTLTGPASPLKVTFDLIGQQRDLVTCGGGVACSRIDQRTGKQQDLAGLGVLDDFSTSVVTSNKKWYLASPDGTNRR